MPDVQITNFSTTNGKFNKASQSMMEEESSKFLSPVLNPSVFHKPESFVYVYSVVDPRPAGSKLVRYLPPLVPKLEIAELKPGEKWTLVTTLPEPMNQHDTDFNGVRISHVHSALRCAMDIVNPSNPSLNQEAKETLSAMSAVGDNYGNLGVFWSLNYPPTDEEVNKAIARKETCYRALVQQANSLQISNPKALEEYLTPTVHIAADYMHEHFGMKFKWHEVPERIVVCPNCGESIKSLDVAYHPSATLPGKICVINWQRTVEAGVMTKADVPDSKRWWGKAKDLHEEVRA